FEGQGKHQFERTAFSFLTFKMDGTPQHLCKLSADRQAKTGATVLSFCGSVSLLKRLENDLTFVLGNSNAGITNRKGNLCRGGLLHRQRYAAFLRCELKRIR